MPIPNRGEVWLVDLGYAGKVRPCLVLSVPIEDVDRALVTVVTHTTSPRNSRFEVPVRPRFLNPGVVDCQNVVTISQAKMLRKLGELPDDDFGEVESKIKEWLGFV